LLANSVERALVAGVAPAELGADQREQLRDRVLAKARDATPEGTVTLRAADTPWVEWGPHIQVKVLRRDPVAGMQTILARMQPGGVMPAHRHHRDEEFVVLEGECHIGTHRLGAGDVHLAQSGSWHEAVTTQTGVVVLLRGEYLPGDDPARP
jgi:quercetin dioxygenase-like cupin family protein